MLRMVALILKALELLLKNRVFTMRTGLAKGLKRRYGFGFKPVFWLTREDEFLMGLDFQGKTVFDVGGYVGIHTLFFARAVGEAGRVVAFEPNPRNYEELIYNTRLNGFDKVTVMQIGLGRECGQAELVIDSIYPARGTVRTGEAVQSAPRGAKKIKIEIFTLDSLMKELPKPDFIKVDVEGLEMDVLHGMRETIDNYKPSLFIEVHGEIPKEMAETLASHGYSVYHVESDTEISSLNLPDVTWSHLFCKCPGQDDRPSPGLRPGV